MHVRCKLRDLRGDRTLRELEALTEISRGTLSKLERGVQFPLDKQIAQLERAYGAPLASWYDPWTLLALERGDGEG